MMTSVKTEDDGPDEHEQNRRHRGEISERGVALG